MHHPLRRLSLTTALAIGALGVLSIAVMPSGRSSKLADASTNPVQIENSLRGTDHWQIKVLSYHREIEGYAYRPSVLPGQTISFAVSTTGEWFKADVYRVGWYGGAGARHLMHVKTMPGHLRAIPKPSPSTGLIACSWPISFSIHVPKAWISGIYLVKLTASNTHQGYIPFTVTDPTSHAPLLFVHGLFTDEAYNTWGGNSLYADIKYKSGQAQYAHRAVKVSFNRPFEQSMGAGWFFSWEIHMVRWLEHRGYNVTYATDLDIHQHPNILLQHKAIMVVGHDEYWSHNIRFGMDAAVAHGVSLANFAANTGYWQVRLEPLGDAPNRVLVCYKTTYDPEQSSAPSRTTTEWRLWPVSMPESELTGAMYGGYDGNRTPASWVVKAPDNWIFKGTGMTVGSKVLKIVGHEADFVHRSYQHPSGLHTLSASPFADAGGHGFSANSTIYHLKNGGWVFNAGTIDWAWGLDDIRQNYWLYQPARHHPSRDIQTITSNILNRFSGSSNS